MGGSGKGEKEMRKTNRSHRIAQSSKLKGHPINKGLLETGLDQYSKGGKYEHKCNNIDEKQNSRNSQS